MHTYKWHGSGSVHTPRGPVAHGDTFQASAEWMSGHPQRKWLKMGLITLVDPVEERPAPKPSKK
jgi:hypothetical protein